MLLGTLGANLLGNMLADKGMDGTGEVIISAGYGSERFLTKKNNFNAA